MSVISVVVCFLIQTLILRQQVFLPTEPSPQALPISEYLIKGFWSYVIFSSLSWTKNSHSLTVLLHFSLPECVDRWESSSTDNIRYKTDCLSLGSSTTELFYYINCIPQFPEQQLLITKVAHFNSIFVRIHWDHIVYTTCGDRNTNRVAFGFSTIPPLKICSLCTRLQIQG